MPMASSRRAPPKRSSAGSWRCSRTRSEWTPTTSAYRSPTRSSTASTGSRSADGVAGAGAEDLQQPGGGALGLGEHRLGQGAVAGDDVAGDLQLVQGQLDLAAVVEVRLEAGPVLDHQLAQLRQREEAEDVVVGGVEQVALAAADLADGDGALHPLLPGGPGRGDHPVVAVHRLVDGPQHGGDDGAQPLFDEIQPDVGAAGPPGARAHLAPGVGAPVQFRPDLHRPCQGHRAGRDVGGASPRDPRHQGAAPALPSSPAHRLPLRTPVPTIKEEYCGAGGGAAGWIRSVLNSPLIL